MLYRFDQDRGDRFFTPMVPPGAVPRLPAWHYDADAGITMTVLIEADTAEEANARAEQIGISFEPEPIEWHRNAVSINDTQPQSGSVFHDRWVRVARDEHGFDTIGEALDDSDEYVFLNPWTVDSDFSYWPVFVHRSNGQFHAAEAFVVWRGEYDKRPVE